MLYGTVPFKANNMSELHQLILKGKYSLKDEKAELSDGAKDLIRKLLEPDVRKRITIEEVRTHSWLSDVTTDVEIFNEAEKEIIKRDFSYNDMDRFRRNEDDLFFTEHALDSTQNALLKNCTTRSVILAPFNSTRSNLKADSQDESPMSPRVRELLVSKHVIKYAARVKDIDRQYEMNNNCELDNGVYNKFVRQSTEQLSADKLSPSNSRESSFESSLKEMGAPPVTQNSDDEAELEVFKKKKAERKATELKKIQSYVQQKEEFI